MDAAGLVIGLMFVLCGLMLVTLSIPLIKEKVGMNHWYGVRVRQSFESPERWYDINRAGGRYLLLGGVMVTAIGGVAMFVDMNDNEGLLLLFTLLPLAVIMVAAAASVLYARRA